MMSLQRRLWAVKSNNRIVVALLLSVAALGCFALAYNRQPPSDAAASGSGFKWGMLKNDAAHIKDTLDELLHVPPEEVGGIAICASIKNEARFITEWLLYHRAVGVDRFYLYDTGSTDTTLEVLQPWMGTGTVVLHRFNGDQGANFQMNSLETCSRTYGPTTDWILDCDVDEFWVATASLTSHQRLPGATTFKMPDQPLRRLLFDNPVYTKADAVVASRVTWKNAGIRRLPQEASVLASQSLRDFYHTIPLERLQYTKSLLHTAKKPGWYIPGAHYLRHNGLAKEKARIITADGRAVPPDDLELGAANPGTLYKGQQPVRVFEPLVMYHYIERDLDNCLEKIHNEQKLGTGSWRVQGGEKGCSSFVLYQPDDWVPLTKKEDFYSVAVKDLTMSNSWYGQHLPGLIKLAHARANLMVAANGTREPHRVDAHPALVAAWRQNGRNRTNGLRL
ncbi:hypothetical protein JCM3770_000549 [Rhodotorula araucariae]